MTIDELILEATVTDVEKHERFSYSVLDVGFENPEAREAFENLSEEDTQTFFDKMSENYSEQSRNDSRY